MARTKTRLDVLRDEDRDYSLPINSFAKKARAAFNQIAKEQSLKTRIVAAEYGDGAARLYVDGGYDEITKFAAVLLEFEETIWQVANDHKKLAALELPVTSVTMCGDEINVNF